jgi:hypothetical protein
VTVTVERDRIVIRRSGEGADGDEPDSDSGSADE